MGKDSRTAEPGLLQGYLQMPEVQELIFGNTEMTTFFFLGPHLPHMEVPRLGVEWELQLLASATATPDLKLHPTPQLTAMPDP